MNKNIGKLITFYGINNIGKSTHAKLLVERLRSEGYESEYVKFPVYDLKPTGEFINGVLRGAAKKQEITEEELQMWYTLNRFQFEPTLKKWLAEGKIVVAEDYTATGLAWGAAKGAKLEWLIEINRYLLKEDFAVHMKGERQIQAREVNHIHENNDDLVESCRFILEELGKKYGWKDVVIQPTIDATKKIIWETVKNYLDGK